MYSGEPQLWFILRLYLQVKSCWVITEGIKGFLAIINKQHTNKTRKVQHNKIIVTYNPRETNNKQSVKQNDSSKIQGKVYQITPQHSATTQCLQRDSIDFFLRREM